MERGDCDVASITVAPAVSAMTILQLAPTIPLLTPLGAAQAYFLDPDDGTGYPIFWCAIDESGEWWAFPWLKVRLAPCLTSQRPTTSPIGPYPGLELHLDRHKNAPATKATLSGFPTAGPPPVFRRSRRR